jgi:NAD(P)-dependent dehydrogenase (short-subunit alcohol dehydrogenase family)
VRSDSIEDAMRGYSALVTGGAQGIGKGIAQALAAAGMQVVILDWNRRAGREAATTIQDAVFVEGDASDAADVAAAVRLAGQRGLGLYAAVANAGIFLHGPLEKFSRRQWDRMLAVHLTGAFLVAKAAHRALAANHGSLVLISSVRAHQAEPGWEAYCAAKGGIVGLTQSLAVSLAPEVRVNCISPGWIPTEQWQESRRRRRPRLSTADQRLQPIGRVGSPTDIGAVARFLVSPDAAFVTGVELVADGGLARKLPAT